MVREVIVEIIDESTFAKTLTNEQKTFLMNEIQEHTVIATKIGFHLKSVIANGETVSGYDVSIAETNAAIASRLCDICEIQNPFQDVLDEIMEFTEKL